MVHLRTSGSPPAFGPLAVTEKQVLLELLELLKWMCRRRNYHLQIYLKSAQQQKVHRTIFSNLNELDT